MVNTYVQRKRGINMDNIRDVLLHCLENDKDYVKYGVEDKGKWINQGWIEALQYVSSTFDTEEKTINE